MLALGIVYQQNGQLRRAYAINMEVIAEAQLVEGFQMVVNSG